MKKLIIVITGLISVAFAAIVIGILFLSNLDLNNYKDWISEKFYEQTGRELIIAGNIESSIYPWLGIELEGLSIANPAGFSSDTFFSADRAAFRIRLMPLLNQEYEIDTVVLSNALLNLEVKADGANNWSGLADIDEENIDLVESETNDDFPFNKLIIGGVAISDVQVNYIDQANAQNISISDFSLNVPELVFGEPLELAMNFQLDASNPDISSAINLSSTLTYDLDNSIYALEDLNLDFLNSNLQANLVSAEDTVSGSINVDSDATAELLGLFGQSELAQKLNAMSGLEKSISLNTNVTFNTDDNNFTLEDFELNFLESRLEADLRIFDEDINGTINFNTDRSRELLTLLDQDELAEHVDNIQVLVFLDGNTDIIQVFPFDLNIGVSGSPLNAPENIHFYTNAEIDIDDENLMLNDLSLSVMELLLEGKFNVSDFMSQPEISGEFDLNSFNPRSLAAALDVDLPETSDPEVLQSLAFSTSLTASSEAFELNRFILELDDTLTSGSLEAENFDQPAFSFDIAVNEINLDRYLPPEQEETATSNSSSADSSFSGLQNLNLDGEVTIDELKVSGLSLSEVVLGVNASQGLIELSPMQADLYDGRYSGSVSLNVNNSPAQFSLQSALQNISIEPLSNDFIGASYASGNGTINLALTGTGYDAQSIMGTINGNADLSLSDGILNGVDVGAVLTQIETMIRSRRLLTVNRGQQTVFDQLSATVQINNGIASSNDLLIQAPGFNVSGTGTLANLQNQSLNFDLLASVNPASATVESQEYDIGGYSLPIKCSGSMNSPSCLPNIDSIVSAAIGNVVQEGIGSILNRVLGSDNNTESTSTDGSNADANTGENTEPAEQQSDPVEQLFNNALDRLFN
jgi:AsmA protein